MLSQIEFLGQSNKTAYTFLREKSKILPINQQLKRCDILQIPPESIDLEKSIRKQLLFNYRNKAKILSN